jgi:4-hydroxy-2-oxoheptanedioate aldolase
MGIPGQFDAPELLAALTRVVDACQREKVAAGILTADPGRVSGLQAMGFNFIAVGSDSSILKVAASSAAASFTRRH